MFLPIKSYTEFLKGHKQEPSIRIGKRVPKNAVNMGYYFNPTATDSEKVLCADAPRNTIDHRVEEQYKYLFDMPEDNNNLFPLTVNYSDEEGYAGGLSRAWVKWYEKTHITESNKQSTKTTIVDDKSGVPTSDAYSDVDGFTGNLYLDTVNYEIKNTSTEIVNTTLKMNIQNHELQQLNVTNSQLNTYMKNPSLDSGSPWPKNLYVLNDRIVDEDGITRLDYNPYDGYITVDKPLTCTNIEKDPLSSNSTGVLPTFSEEYGYLGLYQQANSSPFRKESYETTAEIRTFLTLMKNSTIVKVSDDMERLLNKWDTDSATERLKYKIEIVKAEGESFTIPENALSGKAGDKNYIAGYKLIYTNLGDGSEEDITHDWNVYANYSGQLEKPYEELRIYPVSWEATTHYTGIVRKVWHTYDGVAYYRGSIIKGEGVGNVNPELNPDVLMYPDDAGFLRRFDVNGNPYDTIEAEQFYITNVFKDNTACFFEHKLEYPIHDYRGPDDNGFYEGDAIKVYTSNLKAIPSNYKYQLKLQASEYETVTTVVNGVSTDIQKAKKYDAYLYTSFLSTSTDSYKATYNAFVEYNNDDMLNMNNGIDEEVFNRPFMFPGKDFNIVPSNPTTRTNKIQILSPTIINDTRKYITFEYTVIASKKTQDGTGDIQTFESKKRQAQILNKEYAVESEHNKFIERAMIISPKDYDTYLSPFDIVIKDQAASELPPKVTVSNAHNFVFSCKPVLDTLNSEFVGAINIKCNSDGSGILTAETTLDTGFYNSKTGAYTKKLIINNPYIIENGKIYPGYMVRCLDVRNIGVNQPREDHLLESWNPLIKFGHYSQVMDQYGTHTKVCYSMPEYDTQHWGTLGKPYVDIFEETAEILNPHMIKVRNHPLHVPNINPDDNNVTVLRRTAEDGDVPIHVKAISFTEGIIITKEAISENDVIVVSYTYIEEYYVYRGFYRNELDFCRIDLNPNQYHTYSDMTKEPSVLAPTKNLFNKTIYFYLRPTIQYIVASANDDLIDTNVELDRIMIQNKETLYHTIDEHAPESDMDIYIGSVYIRQNTSLQSTILIDTRTRGGGVLEEMKDSLRKELEPESDFYLDIGCYDGTPYQENAVIIVRLDNSILKEYGGRFTQTDIEEKVKKWLGAGVYPIIEYVDSYSKFDMPQYNLIVEDSYTNVTQETPQITLECIAI